MLTFTATVWRNNGKLYYDHSLLIIKEGELGKKIDAKEKNGNPTKTAGSSSNFASVLTDSTKCIIVKWF